MKLKEKQPAHSIGYTSGGFQSNLQALGSLARVVTANNEVPRTPVRCIHSMLCAIKKNTLRNMKIISEGVLVFASAKGLLKEYKDKEFDYDFPNGISKLLNENIIIALTTSEGDDLIVDFIFGKDSDVPFDKVINQFIKLDEDDELLILSHAEFTQICRKNGDLKKYGWPIRKLGQLDSGIYCVSIKIENIKDRFDEFKAYFRLTIEMKKYSGGMDYENEVFEISH